MLICSRCVQQFRFYATVMPKKWKKPRKSGYTLESFIQNSSSPTFFKETNFVDYKRITVKGGDGGHGAVSFARVWCNPFAGPDGGNGGNGGHVIFTADPKLTCLKNLKDCKAPNGEHGQSFNMFGKCAEHLYVQVPLGTLFRRHGSDDIVGELNREGDIFIAARGGAGGHGNRFFLSNEHRAPQHAEEGAKGEQFVYDVELKVMAHAGLVGFPSAGKSTLLRAISRARPKVSCYPFTTENPVIGTVEYEDHQQFKFADIPGLLPDFNNNYGYGMAFLKHLERCLFLFYVIDLSLPEPWTQLEQLKGQLERHRVGLSRRPNAVVANKIDLPEAEANLHKLRSHTELPVLPISAKSRLGILELLIYFRQLYDLHVTPTKVIA